MMVVKSVTQPQVSISNCKCYIRVQPAGPNPNEPGAHWSQRRPITLGLHSHCPPTGSQIGLYEPVRSHSHAAQTIIQTTVT